MSALGGTDPRILVYQAVVNWLARQKVVRRPENVRVGPSFAGDPSAEYRQTRMEFRRMCDELSASLSVATGRKLSLSVPWRAKHEGDVISVFMSALAVELAAAPMSPAGRKSLEWVLNT